MPAQRGRRHSRRCRERRSAQRSAGQRVEDAYASRVTQQARRRCCFKHGSYNYSRKRKLSSISLAIRGSCRGPRCERGGGAGRRCGGAGRRASCGCRPHVRPLTARGYGARNNGTANSGRCNGGFRIDLGPRTHAQHDPFPHRRPHRLFHATLNHAAAQTATREGWKGPRGPAPGGDRSPIDLRDGRALTEQMGRDRII